MACDDPYTVRVKIPFLGPDGFPRYSAAVPCGKCGVCRKNKVDEWSFRMRQEQLRCDTSHFVTLTYAVPPMSVNGFMTLNPKDVTDYFKRLRTWMKRDGVLGSSRVKYYAVGEYGSRNRRPHYHLIVFNSTVEYLTEAWSRERGGPLIGHVHIDAVNSNTISYCVKYLDKGRSVPAHPRDDRVPEFSRMSKHLGDNYMTPEMVNWHIADLSRNYVQDGSKKIALPRYYREKVYTESQMVMQRSLALQAGADHEQKLRRQFFRDYPHASEADFARDLEFNKYSRYKTHTNGKERNI